MCFLDMLMAFQKFPNLVNVWTVERWLPLHACIINGHTAVLELLLKFPYPDDALRKFWYDFHLNFMYSCSIFS